MAYARTRVRTMFSAHALTLLRLLLIQTYLTNFSANRWWLVLKKVPGIDYNVCACLRSFIVAVVAGHALNYHSDLIIWHGERGKTKNANKRKMANAHTNKKGRPCYDTALCEVESPVITWVLALGSYL